MTADETQCSQCEHLRTHNRHGPGPQTNTSVKATASCRTKSKPIVARCLLLVFSSGALDGTATHSVSNVAGAAAALGQAAGSAGHRGRAPSGFRAAPAPHHDRARRVFHA